MTDADRRAASRAVLGTVLLVAYNVYAFGSGLVTEDDTRKVGVTMLVALGVFVAVMLLGEIVHQVVASVVVARREHESDPDRVEQIVAATVREDEMGRLIALKAGRANLTVVGVGFVAALVVLACDGGPAPALHVLFCSFALGGVAESGATAYFHRRGVSHA